MSTDTSGEAAGLSPDRPWRVAITGATGLVGGTLSTLLRAEGHEVLPIVRSRPKPGEIGWDPVRGEIDVRRLDGIDAVVHLAGEKVAQRWTPRVKARIRQSRVQTTELLSAALASAGKPPNVLVSASAVGIYGDRGEERLGESAPPGHDFLGELAQDWEAATAPAAEAGVRVVLTRFGVVLSRDGGAIARLLPPFRMGVGGRLGSGKQWMSWISILDAVRAIRFALGSPALTGPFNLVSPNPVRNEEFTRVLGSVLRRPVLLPVPRFALAIAFGAMADATLLASQRAFPDRLLSAGFEFRHPDLADALRHALDRT